MTPVRSLARRRFWVFDLDGTLTVAVHDFHAIRTMLGIPDGTGILEALEAMPPEQALPLRRRLDEHERELAESAEPAEGAYDLLEALRARDATVGIVTRNNLVNVETTLAAAGLAAFFERAHLRTRDDSVPKPRPDGILDLLGTWGARPDASVMVGNHVIDLQAGRGAGALTVHVDASGAFPWSEHADLEVKTLGELAAIVRDAGLTG